MSRVDAHLVLSGNDIGTRAVPDDLSTGSSISIDASDVRYVVRSVGRTDDGVLRIDVERSPLASEPAAVDVAVARATTRRVASTDGVEVALHHLGGDGSPLLICHATGFHGLAYAPFAQALTRAHSVWAADLRGHGATAPPANGDFAWAGMGRDVAAAVRCIREQDGRPLHAFGHSMGGAAILFAELAVPGTFAGAYFFEPIVFPPEAVLSEGERFMRDAARARRANFPDREAAFVRYGSRPPLQALREDVLASYVQHGFVDTADGDVTLACEPSSESATFGAPNKLLLSDVEGVELSVAVAAGRRSEAGSPADFAPELVKRLENAVLDEHRTLGHFGPLEAPDRIAERVMGFFAAGPEAITPG